jgi:Fe-S oxidoreductase
MAAGHAFAKAPYLLAPEDQRDSLSDLIKAEATRPLVGGVAEAGVIDPEVIWACTNCGACVNECPVDIEHIDHINGLRRHQVLVESAFPTEATTMLNNLERRGNPWGMAEGKRGDWISELDFEVPVLDGVIPDDTEYLFWVGCAGALDDRAKATTKAVAELLHNAGVSFAVLGPAETCTGDPARRLGNEFVYSTLAQQNIETLNYAGVAKDDGEEGVHKRVHGAGLEAQISGIERGCLDADPDLVGEHLRLRYLDDLEDLRTAEVVVDGRLHDHAFR